MTNMETRASAPDYDAIVSVVQLYVDAYNECSVAKFREAFHENAWIFYNDSKGALHKALLTDCFEVWSAPHTDNVVGRFISVVQAGDVAVVILGFDNSEGRSSSWVDFHTLLRINGVWKITNKTATHNSRGAWAGAEYSHPQVNPSHGAKPQGS